MMSFEEVKNLLSCCKSEKEFLKLLSLKEIQRPIINHAKSHPELKYIDIELCHEWAE